MEKDIFPSLNGKPFENDLMETVLAARYYAPNEKSWDDVITRVSDFLGDNEETKKEFKRLMKEKKFLPNSPALMNAGTDSPMMSACFVLPIEDSMRNIMKTLSDAALIFKSGGGVGINYSPLRPAGSKVGNSNGVASGTVSFMGLFNEMAEVVKSGGKRRGAQISILNFEHPDIYDFITVKNIEGKLNNMNLSVMFTNKDIDTCIRHPEKLHVCGKTYGELFNIIVNSIWLKGEPGVLFYDSINRDVKGYKIEATNPCFSGDTLMLTKQGYRPIITLVGKDVDYWNGEEWSTCKAYHTGYNSVYRVTLSNGMSVDVTENHRWFTTEGTKETKDLIVNQTKIVTVKYPLCDDVILSEHNVNDIKIESTELDFLCRIQLKLTTEGLYTTIKETKNGYVLSAPEPDESPVPISIEYLKKCDTFCLTEPKRHMVVANGIPTSQCGEMPLPAYGSCCLGSFDVSKYHTYHANEEVTECKDNLDTFNKYFDWKSFIRDIQTAALMLDSINEHNQYPLPEIEKVSKFEHRRIGMGIMGYADLLLKLKIPYGSDDANKILYIILNTMKEYTKLTVPNLETYLTIAPTGTISIFANCSSGVEPVFSWVYMRKNTLGKEFLMVHPIFDSELTKMINYSDVLTAEEGELIYRKILNEAYTKGTIANCTYLPDDFKAVFKCARDITPEEHINTQAAAQSVVDSSISKTINLPPEATREQIAEAIIHAWKSRCKGLTMYRDGSREEVVLDLKRDTKTNEADAGMICPECGSKIERSEGCITCHSCGWSRCS